MKFGYVGGKPSELIKSYAIQNNKIIITFLDGTINIIPLTKENENSLLDKMFIQAEERNRNYSLEDDSFSRNRMFMWNAVSILITIFSINLVHTYEFEPFRPFFAWLSGLMGITVIISGASFKLSKDEVQEIKKYAIYLSIKDKIEENIDNTIVFLGIKHDMPLNINTIDTYTLHDLMKIKRNIEMITNNDNKKDLFIRTRKNI